MCKDNGPAVVENPGDLSIREFVKIRFLKGVNSRDQLWGDECPTALGVADLPGAGSEDGDLEGEAEGGFEVVGFVVVEVFWEDEVADHTGDFVEGGEASFVFEQVDDGEFDVFFFEVVEEHAQAEEAWVEFDEGVVGVEVFGDFGNFLY